jgi:rSAM/selenodomain-associated transferase 1/rSAM/selenodomain-associated transferase 2
MQMNAGAAVARGDVLLFLHADTRLPPDFASAIARALDRGYRWGRFDVAIEGRSPLLPLIATTMNARSRASGIATGDQAQFATREAFDRVHGFPLLPLMEDIAFSKALKRAVGRPACLRERVVTSGRRWDERGPWRTIVEMWRTRFDYWRGVDPLHLSKRYRGATRTVPVLQIFAKEPQPGRVKTRLASTLGGAQAARLYRELAEATLAVAVAARDAGAVAGVEVWCDPDPESPLFSEWRRRHDVALRTQRGGDLGERMRNAIVSSLSRGRPALLIGTDAPAIDVAYIARAARALATHDAVVGPADDGGYVLIGLKRDVDVFSNIPWSSEGVMAATRAKLSNAQVAFVELPVLWDVDTPADLARYRAWLERNDSGPPAPGASPARGRV